MTQPITNMDDDITSKRINQPTPFSSPQLLKTNEITPGISSKEYKRRRNAVFGAMKNESLLILPSAPQKYMSPDIVYRYRQNADFLYLSGFIEPSAVLCLHKQSEQNQKFYLFVTEFDPKLTTYKGHIAGTKAAKKLFNVDETFDIKKMDKSLQPLIESSKSLYFDNIRKKMDEESINFCDILLTQKVNAIIEKCKNMKKSNIKKIGTMIQKFRLIKSAEEIFLMRQSSKVAAISMKEVIESANSGILEDRLAAIFEFGCRMRGAARLSAPVTISHGDENNILHYLNNDRLINKNCLALMDTGAEYFGYASDITRVFPTNGTFSNAQLKIYNLVLRVQREIIGKYCVVGGCISKLDSESNRLLKEGLEQMNVCLGDGGDLIDSMWHSGGVHYVSHWIGMDIHDCNDIGHKTKFKNGMCIAVEPGIYLPKHENIKKEYQNIGVRIEDTILINEDEPEILTKDCPKDPNEIMELMKKNECIWNEQEDDEFLTPTIKRKVRRRLFKKFEL